MAKAVLHNKVFRTMSLRLPALSLPFKGRARVGMG